MKYELVLQWPESSIEDFDSVLKIEEALIEQLGEEDEVDGHDAGSGEINVFIRTNNPGLAFEKAKEILQPHDFWVHACVAYHEVGDNNYTILWPEGQTTFRIV